MASATTMQLSSAISVVRWGTFVTAINSCQSLDQALVSDPVTKDDFVFVIGGGISGLYAAYQLKKMKIPYRLFEASRRLGGQFYSSPAGEWGALAFSNDSERFLKLVKELGVETIKIEGWGWTFKNGTQDFIQKLTTLVGGLVPDRQIKMNHQLQRIESSLGASELSFSTVQRDKVLRSKKVLLAMSPYEVEKIMGPAKNDIDISQLDRLRVVRLILPQQYAYKLPKSNSEFLTQGVWVQTLKLKGKFYLTLKLSNQSSALPREIENIEKWVAVHVFKEPRLKVNIDVDHFYDWTSHPTITLGNAQITDAKISDLKKSEIYSVYEKPGSLPSVSSVAPVISPWHRVENLLIQVDQSLEFLI